ncbi:hypothetical protein OAM26_01280 [Porticoccaceae bacterium]|nr:hypothetical protein [Porticoccaceae bacterium]
MNALTSIQKRWLLVLGGALVVLLLLTPQLRQQRLAAIDTNPELPAVKQATTASQRAVLARQRQQTQTLLAEIAVAQEQLQPSRPQQWAASEFTTLQNLLTQGDKEVANSQFPAALASYQRALTLLGQLIDQRPQRLIELLDASARNYRNFALVEFDSNLALAELLAEPSDSVTGQQIAQWRQKQLQLSATQKSANAINLALESNQLSDAKTLLFSAKKDRAIDHQHPAIQLLAEQLASRQRQADYTTALNSGYSALSSDQLDAAASAFNRAAQLQPDSDNAQNGLQQVANQRRQVSIDRQLVAAEQFEQNEQWSQAVSAYTALENSAPGLLEAKVRLISSRVRAEFDQRWRDLTRSPYNLVAADQQRAAQQWLDQAEQINPRGALLSAQMEQLQKQLRQSVQLQQVLLLSDSQTEVTLFRVAQLGRFNQQVLKLLPGRYTALGSCPGHRDRQVQFQVALEQVDSAPLTVNVTCGEAL